MKKANISSNIKKKKNEMILKLTIKYNYYMLNRRDHFEAITSETNESTWEELLYVKLSKKTLTISQNLLIKWGNTKKKKLKGSIECSVVGSRMVKRSIAIGIVISVSVLSSGQWRTRIYT